MEQGFIILQRKISENWLWLSEPFSKAQAWVDLLLLANHAEGSFFLRGIKVVIKRGQVGKSEENLSQRWKWSRGKVRNFLKLLETEQQIKQLRSPVLNIIEIINYDLYQKMDNKKNNKTTTKKQQNDTNKEEEIIIKEEIKNRPTLEQIKDYCLERKNSVNPEKWMNHYEANGWKVGKNPMKNWKACVRTWENSDFTTKPQTKITNKLAIELNQLVGKELVFDAKIINESIKIIMISKEARTEFENLNENTKQKIRDFAKNNNWKINPNFDINV